MRTFSLVVGATALLLSPAGAQERPGLADLSEFVGTYTGIIDTGANSHVDIGEIEITVTTDHVQWRVATRSKEVAQSQRAGEFENLPYSDLMWQLPQGDIVRTRPYGFREHSGALYVLKTRVAQSEPAFIVRGWLFGGMRRIALFSAAQVARGAHAQLVAELEKDGEHVSRLSHELSLPKDVSLK